MSDAYRQPTEAAWRQAWSADAAWRAGVHLRFVLPALSTALMAVMLLGVAAARPFAEPGRAAGGWIISAILGAIGALFGWATPGALREGLRVIAPMWRPARVDEGAVTERTMKRGTRHSFAEHWLAVGPVRLLVPGSVYEAVAVGARARVEHGGAGGPARRLWL